MNNPSGPGGPYRAASMRLEAPPRHVPLALRARLLFGGPVTQFGWLFLCLGLLFSFIFLGEADLAGITQFRGALERASGTVVESEATSSSENDRRVYAIHYRFVASDGTDRVGVSYTTGKSLDSGSTVAVEYPTAQPGLSRIEGMRTRPFGAVVLFVLLFPLVGAAIALGGAVRGVRASGLLARGRVAHGRLVSRVMTKVEVNDRPVWKLTFEFKAEDGSKHMAEATTLTPAVLEDDPEEQLVYDPRNPRRASLIDHLPGAPRIDDEGRIAPADPTSALVCAMLPAIAVLGTLTMCLVKLAG